MTLFWAELLWIITH
ncbi:hypothetical protein [Escherichia coli]